MPRSIAARGESQMSNLQVAWRLRRARWLVLPALKLYGLDP